MGLSHDRGTISAYGRMTSGKEGFGIILSWWTEDATKILFFPTLVFCMSYAKTRLWTQDRNTPTIPGASCGLLHVLDNDKRVASEGSQNPPDQIFSKVIALTVAHTKQRASSRGQ